MRWLLCAVLLVAGCRSGSQGQGRNLEAEFERTMTGATLVGKFSAGSSDKLNEDRYTISKVTRMPGDVWLIHTRIQYGGNDYTVPVPVKVLWAGDTPVITLTDVTIPGHGSFTARVLIYRDQYAGTWSASNGHGGQMFGRIEHK